MLLLAVLLATPESLCAQTASGAAVSTSRQTAAEIEDIGEFSPPGQARPANPLANGQFRFDASVTTTYTSNSKLSGNHGSGDVIWSPTVEAGYHAALGHGFAVDSLLRIESGLYTTNTDRTYLGYSLENTLEWRPKLGLPRVFVGFEPYRYDGTESSHLITEALGLSAGTDWGVAFNRGQSLFFVGYTFADYFSNPGSDTRTSHSATIGVTTLIRPKLYGQLYYQYELESYEMVDRTDHRHVVGLSFIYQLDEHLFMTLSGDFVDNSSNADHASYQSAGASLGFNYHF